MKVIQTSLPRNLTLLGILSGGLCGCAQTVDSGIGTNSGGGAGGEVTSGIGGAVSNGGTVSTGGTIGVGGATAAGGTGTTGAIGPGGQPNSGGTSDGVSASGGRIGSGGATASGGRIGSGGATAAGGMSVANGGVIAKGGTSANGGVAGRNPGRGGAAATSGAAGKGNAGGATVSGGATSAGASGGASPGCGSSNTTSPCSKSGTTCSLDVGGTARTYYVQLPSSYSSSKQYPLIFQFHPMGGTAEQALTMYRISAGIPDAIYVTPQGLSSGSSTGWANTNGQDIAFTKAMLADVQAKYCVDNARIFSTGFSYGGMMSFAIGCEMGDVFRAIAPMSGALYSDFNCKGTGHAIAMWGSHGLSDTVVPIADGRAARDKILQQNHCGTQTTPIDPSPCVSYQGCDAGYPVTWCEWDGQHGIPSFGSSAIAAFFKQF